MPAASPPACSLLCRSAVNPRRCRRARARRGLQVGGARRGLRTEQRGITQPVPSLRGDFPSINAGCGVRLVVLQRFAGSGGPDDTRRSSSRILALSAVPVPRWERAACSREHQTPALRGKAGGLRLTAACGWLTWQIALPCTNLINQGV